MSPMSDVSEVMTTEDLCTFFHQAHHMRDPDACLKLAELYGKCEEIDENKRCSLLWCRLARTFSSGSEGYNAFKKRSAALMRATMAELSDDEMEPVLDSLSLFSNVDLSLESNPQHWPFRVKAVVKLEGHGGSDVYLPAEAWSAYLKAGRSFGWQPQGTSAPVTLKGAWDGSYSPAVGQHVKRDDARRLSMALDRLVDAVRSGEGLTEEQLEAVKALACLDKDLSGPQEVADYALEGGFSVEDADGFRR